MARLFFRPAAEADLVAIGDFTREHWGTKQALQYVAELEACCKMAAERPELGRVFEDCRRLEQGSHSVFYQVTDAGDVEVVRILHARMLPERHLVDDDESSG